MGEGPGMRAFTGELHENVCLSRLSSRRASPGLDSHGTTYFLKNGGLRIDTSQAS
jgi:hypothetical protein